MTLYTHCLPMALIFWGAEVVCSHPMASEYHERPNAGEIFTNMASATVGQDNWRFDIRRLDKRSGAAFSTETHNSPAMNAIHVIAAVIGVMGAAMVCISLFVMWRRRRREQQRQYPQRDSTCSIEPVALAPPEPAYNHRFHIFENDYYGKTADTASPSMQQYHLQVKMWEQFRPTSQRSEQHTTLNPPPYQP